MFHVWSIDLFFKLQINISFTLFKEVYIINQGLNVFYYTYLANDNQDVDSVLASGFLSAIESFSKETRESSVESFASENELFLFDHLEESFQLISVFDKYANLNAAKSIMQQIKNLVNIYNVPQKFSATHNVNDEEYQNLFDQLDELRLSTSSVETIAELAEDYFINNSSLNLIAVYSLENKKINYQGARPSALFKPTLLQDFDLINTTVDKIAQKFETETYDIITIKSKNYCLSITKVLNSIIVVYGPESLGEEVINGSGLKIMNSISFDHFLKYYPSSFRSCWEISEIGNLKVISGETPISMAEIFFSSYLNAISQLYKKITSQNIEKSTIYLTQNDPIKLEFITTKSKSTINFYK
jgi:hypothetical protein